MECEIAGRLHPEEDTVRERQDPRADNLPLPAALQRSIHKAKGDPDLFQLGIISHWEKPHCKGCRGTKRGLHLPRAKCQYKCVCVFFLHTFVHGG